MFVREGFAGASMERLAREAGVSKMTIYRRFADKEELFIETINQHCDQIYDDSEYPPAATVEEARARLLEFGKIFIDTVTSPDVIDLYCMLVAEAARFPQLGNKFYECGPARTLALIRNILSKLTTKADARDRASAYMHIVLGDAFQRCTLAVDDPKTAAASFRRQINMATQLTLCGLD